MTIDELLEAVKEGKDAKEQLGRYKAECKRLLALLVWVAADSGKGVIPNPDCRIADIERMCDEGSFWYSLSMEGIEVKGIGVGTMNRDTLGHYVRKDTESYRAACASRADEMLQR